MIRPEFRPTEVTLRLRRLKERLTGLPDTWTPETSAAAWYHRTLSSRDEEKAPVRSGETLAVEQAQSPGPLGGLVSGIIVGLFATVFISVGGLSILGLFLNKVTLGSVFLALFNSIFLYFGLVFAFGLPAVVAQSLQTLRYNRRFDPPRLLLDSAALHPGGHARLSYQHALREPRQPEISGFVLSELFLAVFTEVPDDGMSIPSGFEVLWSSGVQVHGLAASAAGITLQRTVELPAGRPASGPAPTEAGELRREHVWCFRVREVLYPNASCDYEFLLPLTSAGASASRPEVEAGAAARIRDEADRREHPCPTTPGAAVTLPLSGTGAVFGGDTARPAPVRSGDTPPPGNKRTSMNDFDPPSSMVFTADNRPAGSRALPRALLVGGGLVAGTVLLLVLAAVATLLLGVVLTAVTVGAGVLVLVAFWLLWPALVYSLQLGRVRAEDALTRANPVEALQLQREGFARQIDRQKEQLIHARGELNTVERQLQTSRSALSPERAADWEARIAARHRAYADAERRVLTLDAKLADFDRQLERARAEMNMAWADSALGSALVGSPQAPGLSRTSQVAFESISRELGRSSARLELALKEVPE